MTTIIHWDSNSRDNRILCKGAPEIIEKLLGKVPENYREAY